MKRKLSLLAFSVAVLVGLIGVGLTVFGGNSDTTEAAAERQFAVALRGTDLVAVPTDLNGEPNDGPDGVGDNEAACFTGDLVNLNNNKVIGTAVDCLSNVNATEFSPQIILNGTAIFNFPQGQLVSTAATTVSPLQQGTGGVQEGFTHATGAPAPMSGSNIIDGTGAFKNAEGNGTVRLSGLVNMSKLASDGTITFDCVFIINLS